MTVGEGGGGDGRGSAGTQAVNRMTRMESSVLMCLAKRHHRDGSEDQEEQDDGKPADHPPRWV